MLGHLADSRATVKSLHDNALMCIVMRHGSSRHHRSVRVHRSGTVAPVCAAPRVRGGLRHRRHAGGHAAAALYPSLAGRYPTLVFEEFELERQQGSTSSSSASRTRPSMALAPQLVGAVGCVVDLSAAYRLKDASLYPTWYGFDHDQPEAAGGGRVRSAGTAPRRSYRGARLVATPGCHVTAATLALGPAGARWDWSERTASSSTASPASAVPAGRLKHTSLFCTADEDVHAYGLLDHRHTPEIEQAGGGAGPVHTAPRPAQPGPPRHVLRPADAGRRPPSSCWPALGRRYRGPNRSWSCGRRSPSTKATLGTNTSFLTARYDERTGTVISHLRDRQPGQGCVRRGGAGRQRRARPCRDRRPPLGRAVPVSATFTVRRAMPRAGRGAAVHPSFRRSGGGRQVRRQRARRRQRGRRAGPLFARTSCSCTRWVCARSWCTVVDRRSATS